MQTPLPSDQLYVPMFVTVTFMDHRHNDKTYTVSNDASGKHFAANSATVTFIEALRSHGSYEKAKAAARLADGPAKTLLDRLVKFGVVVARGRTQADASASPTPWESRVIMLRTDILDAGPLMEKLSGLGRFSFSFFGLVIWFAVIVAALTVFARNADKVAVAIANVPSTSLTGIATFIVMYILLKAVHEFGHALAYQEMCRRNGLEPGPIRMGISLFAFTPFPFTNVSGAWRLRSRKERAAIGAGGLYFEFFGVACATLLWASLAEGILQSALFHTVMFATLSSLLFNLNPVVKLDGYYILSDLAGLPNLTGRASQAAQSWLGRRLGAEMPVPARGILWYWCASYFYRWVIFAGIFWLAYQVDPRLGPPMLLVVVMMLVVRPLSRALGQARKQAENGLRLGRAIVFLTLFTVILLVPFRDRVLMDGKITRFETTFVQVPEPARVRLDEKGLPVFDSLALTQAQTDLDLRQELAEVARRAIAQGRSAAEQARLDADLAQTHEMQSVLDTRTASLTLVTDHDHVWTALTVDAYDGAWVRPNQQPLGALSKPVPAGLVLWLAARDFEPGLFEETNDKVSVRLVHDPDCTFEARLNRPSEKSVVRDAALRLGAEPINDGHKCWQSAPSGSAIVARKSTNPKSLAERLWSIAQRALQDRLSVGKTNELSR